MATNYDINYDDQRFQDVENEKNAQLSQLGNAYNDMINNSDQFYQDQIDAVNDYRDQQQELQNEQTEFAIQKIEQEKDKTLKDYTKEQKGAYVDYQKQLKSNAQSMANSGMATTGFSESSQVSMFNTYQNRVSTAREVYNQAILNYNNSIQEARLNNNSRLAEIAYNSLKETLALSLEAFQYKNTLILDKMDREQELNNTYYQRWQDVQTQINTENALKEQIRQYDEQLAYYKAKDEREYQLEIQKLEEQKRQAQQAQANWEKEFALAKQQATAKITNNNNSGGAKITKATETTASALTNIANGVKNAISNVVNGATKKSVVQNGVSNAEYNKLLNSLRAMYNTTNGKAKNAQFVKDTLAASNLSDTQIKNALKALGIK